MSNRAQRRAGRTGVDRKTHRPPPAVGQGPIMSVFAERGAVVVHIGMGDIWVNQVRMSAADAEHHAQEILDVARGIRTGLVVADRPSGLIVPGGGSIMERPRVQAGPPHTDHDALAVPDRIAIDAKGYGWRVWDDEDYWSMVPTNPDNSPIPQPVTWFVPRLTSEDEHAADFYNENHKVLPTCQCGWEGTWLSSYDEAADAYAEHRIEVAHTHDYSPPEVP